MNHIPVLLNEVIKGLDIKKGDVVFDATLGSGGHSAEMCRIVGKEGKVIGIDADADAIAVTDKRFSSDSDLLCGHIFKCENFRNLDLIFDSVGIKSADKFLFDLGTRIETFENSGRGFTFQKNEPLVMTFSKEPLADSFTAEEILNEWDEDNIASVIYGYSGEQFAKNIARNIVLNRKKERIKTTFQLVDIIALSVPAKYKNSRIHFATRTFQALRIAVNDEINALRQGIEKAFCRLKINGRMAVISFHSIEDRSVKRFFMQKVTNGEGIIITKKPIEARIEEKRENPRSRSAKLRIIQKTNQ